MTHMDLEREECSDFLKKAYEMVDDPSTDSIVSWSPNGMAFIVWLPEECMRDILPKYLQVTTFSRFEYYGFRRLVAGKEEWVFDCDGFVRGKPELLDKICERHLARLQASLDKEYKPLEDRLKNCKTKEEVELARKEHRERLNNERMEQLEAFKMSMAAAQKKAAALALEDQRTPQTSRTSPKICTEETMQHARLCNTNQFCNGKGKSAHSPQQI
ncbi:unnamed protein product [Arabis nemorensis]|uniref:HSF-type DNA-binding domain-containing protein n=1 Tax=Arabis nemorensis TaxID=586526 RepID=A0A565CFS6_9BRAS|nr:unnamed protein product [Arabis nemorensis]